MDWLQWEPRDCHEASYLLRKALASLKHPWEVDAGTLSQEFRSSILQWEARRQQLLNPHMRTSKHAWDLHSVLQCLLLSGFFRTGRSLRDAVLAAVPVVAIQRHHLSQAADLCHGMVQAAARLEAAIQ